MTDLTEKWKRGELPVGSYYASYLGEPRVWSYRDKQNQTYDLEYEIYEVLAKVPSYSEWEAAQEQLHKEGIWYTEISHKKVLKENAQLKELLKECQKYIETMYSGAKNCNLDSFSDIAYHIGRELLTKIDEVLK